MDTVPKITSSCDTQLNYMLQLIAATFCWDGSLLLLLELEQLS